MTRDPAVDIWAAAMRELGLRPGHTPDRRTPFEVERDNGLEDIAEARADHRNYDYDGLADEAADRYEKGLGL